MRERERDIEWHCTLLFCLLLIHHAPLQVKLLVSRMRTMIYPKIEEFVSDACATLQAQLQIPFDPRRTKDLRAIQDAYEANKSKLSAEVRCSELMDIVVVASQ
jgi:hypothetical protein